MDQLTIKRPRIQDRPAINQLFKASITEAFQREGIDTSVAGLEQEILEKQGYLAEDLETQGENRFFLVAWRGEEMVGTICWGPANGDIMKGSAGALAGIREIGGVYILPAHQKQGIGRQLLAAMLLQLDQKGIEDFCLDCGFQAAQQIWKRLLGEPAYHLKEYWGQGADHMIWHCRVKQVLEEFKKKAWI